MLSTPLNTALILFTRTPQEEVAHKRILKNGKVKQQKQLFQLLVQHARSLGQQTGLPFFVVDSTSQQGATFGERLHSAFAALFARGYAKVIAIGNDCVQLKAGDIQQAALNLQNNQAIFGPAQDGGVYLLGLDQTLFQHKPGFTEISWQKATVLADLQTWCAGFKTLLLPKVYCDLDSCQEVFATFATKQLPFAIMAFLANILITQASRVNHIILRVNRLFASALFFRGPPVLPS
ncbi:TIGR04282 family arsenosugar biosynthesis glycosyltransferase [Adhaeribacter pallidiroseus]|uniref:2-phospho-L-lactate guanylyltransferase n=1 Tax=Adhaeribacter pallidiroseus TaxID=2072847 RepID=A0A369QIU9_9BACT|nr:DUF2064 domain-containing protein [Adhaeribacter pallidiroseus]RDC63156.1 hypothetical protein AHMF7616_01757 [Adhaeribacter pallidiroseus]